MVLHAKDLMYENLWKKYPLNENCIIRIHFVNTDSVGAGCHTLCAPLASCAENWSFQHSFANGCTQIGLLSSYNLEISPWIEVDLEKLIWWLSCWLWNMAALWSASDLNPVGISDRDLAFHISFSKCENNFVATTCLEMCYTVESCKSVFSVLQDTHKRHSITHY